MANKEEKVAENVTGKYYVDTQCIACGVCVNEAANNFKLTDDQSTAYVYKQPENDQEKEECDEAKDNCPVDAIGDDGA